jgi:hypothetical protein
MFTTPPRDLDMNQVVGTHDLMMITFDTLRFDVANALLSEGGTPELRRWLGAPGWEPRYTPGSFTYAAHHAFFAGFLPTPKRPGSHPRRFATSFHGSTTTTAQTCAFEQADIISGLAARGYHTACVGGVGFFNKKTALGRVFPQMFAESHWSEALGVTAKSSTQAQVQVIADISRRQQGLTFFFLNISALHQPNAHYLEGATQDSLATHAAALNYVDGCMPALEEVLRARQRPCMILLMGDHGTAYGEDGFTGHRIGHDVVMTVPYAETIHSPQGSHT